MSPDQLLAWFRHLADMQVAIERLSAENADLRARLDQETETDRVASMPEEDEDDETAS